MTSARFPERKIWKGLFLKWVLTWIRERCWLVVAHFLDTQIFEDLEQGFALLTEGNRAVMREAILNKDMTVESLHILDGEDGDGTEGMGGDR